MTEQEAKDLRCCGPDGCGVSYGTGYERARYCNASACMGWRTLKEFTGEISDIQKPGFNRKSLNGEWEKWIDTGYCGLAGKP